MAEQQDARHPMIELSLGNQYEVLFSVACRHDYYPDGRCTDLTAVPDTATQALLKRFKLMWRPLPDGVAVLYQKGEGRAKALIQLDEAALCFRFDLRLRNPLLPLFTDLPLLSGGQLFRFHNLAYQAAEGEDTRCLHPQPYAGPSELIAARPMAWASPLPEGTSGNFDLRNGYGDTLWPLEVPDGVLRVDLRREPRGAYAVFRDGQPFDSFFTHEGMAPLPFGHVEVHLRDDLDKRLSARHKGLLKTRPYWVRLQNLPLEWHYVVAPQQGSPSYSDFSVVDKTGKLTFGKPEPAEVPGQPNAIRIRGAAKWPLSHQLDYRPELRMRRAGKDYVVATDLPLPNTTNIVFNRSSGQNVVELFTFL